MKDQATVLAMMGQSGWLEDVVALVSSTPFDSEDEESDAE